MQPLAAVTITLYVPPALTTGLAVVAPLTMLGPDQLYVPPPPPVSVELGLLQSKLLLELAVGLGGVVFWLTTTTLVFAVQPFPPVTVKLYVPPALTTGLAVVAPLTIPGPDQLYVPPPPPVRVELGLLQVKLLLELAVGLGGVAFWLTTTLVLAVQPFPPVTVKLYVPPALTTGLAVLAPLTILGPVQL